MFKKILVPLDFTDKNAMALETACTLSDPAKTQLVLIHVIEKIEHLTRRELVTFYRQLESRASSRLAAAERTVRGRSRNVKQEIVFGRRAEEIVRYATRQKIDLIVMSSNPVREEDLQRSWATVSHIVAVLSPCTTMLVK
jgi:nucleotide-binding universal stress UspA family protein